MFFYVLLTVRLCFISDIYWSIQLYSASLFNKFTCVLTYSLNAVYIHNAMVGVIGRAEDRLV